MNNQEMNNLKEKYNKSIYNNKWKKEEIDNLKILINNDIKSATFIYKEKIFPNRSYNSILCKIHYLTRTKR